MQTTPAAKRKAFFGFNAIACGVLLLLLIGLFSVSSAESTGYFTGRVWNDLNNDGLMDDAEPGVEGVTLHLLRSDTGEQLTAVTDNTGTYLFSGLPNDSYTFSVSVPQSMLYARYRKDGGDLRSVFTGEDLSISRSFVVRDTEPQINMNVGLVDSAIIKGMAYLDLNYNGNYDEGEPPYANVTMEVIRNASERSVGKMVTDETGAFFFDATRSGNYRLRAILPDDGSTFTAVPVNTGFYSNLFAAREGRRENSVNSIDVENSMVYEYYVGVALGGRITGTVFLDKNYSGVWENSDSRLSGFTVQLIRADGTIAAETNSSNKGVYTFSEVMPGEYTLRFLRRDGYTFTKYRAQEENGNTARLAATDTYGETESFSFSMAETLEGLNAGFLQSATLGGIFFYDVNDNGLMDENETGFTDGQVRLVSDDGEIDITQTVNADGSYSFGGVAPTTYTLYYLLPENAEMAAVTGGGNTLRHQGAANAVTGLDIKAKKNYTQPLVGAVKLGTFEGYAFDDLNANGLRDDGEATLAGVTVSLQSNNAPANDATVTTRRRRPVLHYRAPPGQLHPDPVAAGRHDFCRRYPRKLHCAWQHGFLRRSGFVYGNAFKPRGQRPGRGRPRHSRRQRMARRKPKRPAQRGRTYARRTGIRAVRRGSPPIHHDRRRRRGRNGRDAQRASVHLYRLLRPAR